jgi:predicted nucleotidyltransferase
MCLKSSEFHKKVRAWAEPISEIRSVILYGSRARDDHQPDSDWDICILVETANSKNGEWFGTWIACADSWHESFCDAVGLEKSVVQFVAPTSDAVKAGIAISSKVIYVRDDVKRK